MTGHARRHGPQALWLLLIWLAFPGSTSARTLPALDAGAVAAPDRYGADAAAQVLAAGGNAVDAAVATAFTLAVTYPQAGNLGGGGFMTLYVGGQPYFLDYRERAPLAATRDMYLDGAGEVIADASLVGHRAVGVPGTVAGLWLAHQRFGKLPWRRDLAPALRLARDGFRVSRYLDQAVREERRSLAGRTNFDRYYAGVVTGARWRQPQLAATLERIARDGADGFYGGDTAALLVAEMRRGGGLVSAADLTSYRAVWREPLTARWRGYTVITAPPPSSGGIGLMQLLEMKDALAPLYAGVAHNSAQYVHLMAEMEKLVFADRAEYLGDPDYFPVPVAQLIDPDYVRTRSRQVDRERPSPTAAVRPGLAESHHTTHFSIVDRAGNAVSNTYTLNDDFGSGVVVEGAGFLLNDEMDDFSAKPGVPNLFGVVSREADAIAPGKRPLSSMTPTILTRDDRVALVLGTPGGSRIFTSVFQVICNLYDFNLPVADALAAPRIHHQLLPPDTLYEEPYAQLAPSVRAQLERRGYRFEAQDYNGDMQLIRIEGRTPVAAADPRGIGVTRTVR